jgi:hypothetical protein
MALLPIRQWVSLVASGMACALALACSSVENNHAQGTVSTGGAGSSAAAFSQPVNEPSHAGGAGAVPVPSVDNAAAGNAARTGEGAAGAGGDADSDSGVDQVHEECTIGETCGSKCMATIVSCSIESLGFACEFDGFVGASTSLTCGERAVIGTACCGGCGCVPVEVYFDGKHCWEGVPQCTLEQFSNEMFDPHGPTPPDAPPFTPPINVPGTFTFGVGGTGGTSGSVTTVSGGSGGFTSDAGANDAGANDAGNAGNAGSDGGAPSDGGL